MNHDEVWVLGASGRTGRAIAARLHADGVPLVLFGRDRTRLQEVAEALDGAPRLVVGLLDQAIAELARCGDRAPAVVVSTVGPFTTTALAVARACPPGTHYVDVSNELGAAQDVLALDRQAAAAGQVLVTGAGFGVLATEAVVLRVCQGQPRPASVRTDALASVALEEGRVGPALAATIVQVVAHGGREVRAGRLVRARAADHFAQITTPDGDALTTGSGASAELVAAWRASGADTVIAASPAAPSRALVRAALPALSALLRLPLVAAAATWAIARIPLRATAMSRASSFGHAVVTWPNGQVRHGWLRAGEATDFAAAVAAQVAVRLRAGQGRPGAHTPGALFGAELAEAVGASITVEGGPDIPAEASGAQPPERG